MLSEQYLSLSHAQISIFFGGPLVREQELHFFALLSGSPLGKGNCQDLGEGGRRVLR